MGIAFATGNLWFAAARSMIPLALNARIFTKERLPEKHKGVDDVYLLKVAGGKTLQVDQAVYEAVDEGESLQKSAWSTELQLDAERIELRWSPDMKGMSWVMPLATVLLVWLALIGSRRTQVESRLEPAERTAATADR